MDGSEPNSSGWMEALRRTGDSLLGLVQSRFELFTLELREEKLRDLNLLIWLAVALAFIVAGLLFALGTLAIYLWNAAGYAGLIVLAVATIAAGAAILAGIVHRIQAGPGPFAETIAEFRKDRECLRKND